MEESKNAQAESRVISSKIHAGDHLQAYSAVMLLAVGLRVELKGQLPGLPDVRDAVIPQPIGDLAWTLFPELSQRLLNKVDASVTNVAVMKPALQPDIIAVAALSDLDLRREIHRTMRLCDFEAWSRMIATIASNDDPGACAMLAVPFERGNIIGVTLDALTPPTEMSPADLFDDRSASRISAFSRVLEREDYAWSPGFDDDLLALPDEPEIVFHLEPPGSSTILEHEGV